MHLQNTTTELKALLDEFRNSLVRDNRAVEVTDRYLSAASGLLRYVAEKKDSPFVAPDLITLRDIEAYLDERCKRDGKVLSGAFNNEVSGIRCLFRFLERHERVAKNPALHVKKHKQPKYPVTPLTWNEFFRLEDAVERISKPYLVRRNLALVNVGMISGLRVKELVGLNLDQLDRERSVFLNVPRKGAKSPHLAIDSSVIEVIDAYLPERLQLLQGEAHPALFVSQHRRRLHRRTAQGVLTKAKIEAGIQIRCSPHTVRHTTGAKMLEAGIDPRTIQEHFGHEDPRTTARYTDTGSSTLEATNVLGKLVKRKRRKWLESQKGSRHEREETSRNAHIANILSRKPCMRTLDKEKRHPMRDQVTLCCCDR